MTEIVVLPPPPVKYHDDNDLWLDEQIWGHRLWEQDPWLLFLEFLSVAEASHTTGKLFSDDATTFPFSFRPAQRPYLRNLLFNNEKLLEFADLYPDNETGWAKWLEWMQNNAKMVAHRDFSYLKKRFENFQQLVKVIEMLRSATIESSMNKRWSSRFVFPFGRHAIYEDLNTEGGREYINFTRNGDLLYQMLARSSAAPELARHFAHLFERRDPCDRLTELLQPEIPEERHTRTGSYLPYAKHPAFEMLAQDWLAVLELQLPRFDAYPYLTILGALHITLYQLQVAAHVCDKPKPHFICEVVAPKKTLVRELSAGNYIVNNQLSISAVDTYVRNIGNSPEWIAAAAEQSGFAACREIMREKVRWPNAKYTGPAEPDALLEDLRHKAQRRHIQHTANIHNSLGRGAGLVSRRGTNRLRYAPTDELLKALILANVPVRMDYGQFLGRLYDRYGLVFGEQEGQLSITTEDFDKRAFQANSSRLENRLKTIGMLRRLSDACAYVENPLRRSAA